MAARPSFPNPMVDPGVKIKIRSKPVRFRISKPKNLWAHIRIQNRNLWTRNLWISTLNPTHYHPYRRIRASTHRCGREPAAARPLGGRERGRRGGAGFLEEREGRRHWLTNRGRLRERDQRNECEEVSLVCIYMYIYVCVCARGVLATGSFGLAGCV